MTGDREWKIDERTRYSKGCMDPAQKEKTLFK